MKKFLKVFFIFLGSIISVIFVGCLVVSLIHMYPSYVSRNPGRTASKTSLRLPEYNVVDSSVHENPISA